MTRMENSNILKPTGAVLLWYGTAVHRRWLNGRCQCAFFLSPDDMRVLTSAKIATPNPFTCSRKQWESNCRHKWLSGDAAQATKNWTYDQVEGFIWMPLEHIIPSAIWFKDTVFEPYKENTEGNPANNWRINHGFMCMEQIQNIIQSSETPLSLW